MDKKFDLIAIGRAAVDFNAVEINRPLEETNTFAKFVGGSPVNIAIGSARFDQKIGFIGKISDDQLGDYVEHYLEKNHVNTDGIVRDAEGHKIGLTFTEILSPEESRILMYRNEAADLYLSPEEVSEEYIASARQLVISGTGLAKSPSREAILTALAYAKENNVKVIFELDYRPYTWKSEEETSLYYKIVARQADMIIGTEKEYYKLFNTKKMNRQEMADWLFDAGVGLVLIKVGIKGSYAYTSDGEVTRGASFKTKVLKSFGAGDSYAAAFLYAYSHGYGLKKALNYGAASASIVISQLSSSEAMPDKEKIEEFLASAEEIGGEDE